MLEAEKKSKNRIKILFYRWCYILIFEGFPLNIGWELTLACNLRCSHCASSAGLPRPNELTTKEALKLCDQFPNLLVQQVDFTGGEPLLRKDWMDIALHLHDLGIIATLLTNGLVLDCDIVSLLKEAGISNIGMSLDGLEQTHDHIRKCKGSFKSVIRDIKILQKANLPFIIITTVNALNVHELPAILQLLRSLKVRCWRIQPMIPTGRVKNFEELGIDANWIMELVSFIQYWKPKAKENETRIICGDGLHYIDENLVNKPWRGCPAGIITCGIKSDGKVIGCLTMPDELVEGDLRKNDLWDIWYHPDSFAYTRRFSPDQLGSNCNSCSKAKECLGGCSICSYAVEGRFHNNPYCFYRNSQTTHLATGNGVL